METNKPHRVRRSGRPTDSQRSKVYAAERATFDGDSHAPFIGKAREPLTERDAQKFAVAAVDWLDSKGYRCSAYVTPRVTIRRGEGAVAYSDTGRIELGRDAPYRWIILHEVAHLIGQPPEWDGPRDKRAHGAEFCHVYLRLVRHYLGVAAHDALRSEMKARKVRYAPQRKRTLTDDQKAALAERLAANRPAPSPHRYAFAKVVPETGVTVYASAKWNDTYRWWTDPTPERPNSWCSILSGTTTDPLKALTRVTVAGLGKTAKRVGVGGKATDDTPVVTADVLTDTWQVVDIAALLAPAEAEAAAKAAAAKAAVERVAEAKALRQRLVEAALDVTDPELLRAALDVLDPDVTLRAVS